MKTFNLTISMLLLFGWSYSQSDNETGSSQFYDFMEAEDTAFYGMKIYINKGTVYLFITDVFTLCSETSKSDTWDLEDDLQTYIEGNSGSYLDGADKYVNYGGLTGYTHICYFYEKGNSKSENISIAKRGRNNAIKNFKENRKPNYDSVIVVDVEAGQFDFFLPCK
ncbi:hypothetical protein [Mesoflavibacter sp. CH_XMU1422-2]|uniref:hypothetical protein n=1 Tax=Mesoflavibacter sp. CH_XMU1422-2 TaxID=3107770 RepID=UPI003008108D